MDWIDATIRSFGQAMGMDHLELDNEGLVALTFDDGGELALQDLHPLGGNEFLVSLVKPFPGDPQHGLRTALKAADYRLGAPWTLQVGQHGHELLVTLRMPRSALMPSSLEEAVGRVQRFHEELARGL